MNEESNLVLTAADSPSAPITNISPMFQDFVDLETLLSGVVEGFDDNLQSIEASGTLSMDSGNFGIR